MRSFLGVPILIRGAVWGKLCLTEKQGGDFDQADEDVVVLLASWAAIAIEHARRHGGSSTRRQGLERAVRRLRATQEITPSSTYDPA